MLSSMMQELIVAQKNYFASDVHGLGMIMLDSSWIRSWIIQPKPFCDVTCLLHYCLRTELRLNTEKPLRCAIASPCFGINGLHSYFSATQIEVDCDLLAVIALGKIALKLLRQSAYNLPVTESTDLQNDHNFKVSITIPSPDQEIGSLQHDPRVSLGTWNGALDGIQAAAALQRA